MKKSTKIKIKELKSDDSLVIWIALFIAGFGVGIAAEENELSIPLVPEWILDMSGVVVATFVAAAGGSYFAFRLERENDRRVRETENLLIKYYLKLERRLIRY